MTTVWRCMRNISFMPSNTAAQLPANPQCHILDLGLSLIHILVTVPLRWGLSWGRILSEEAVRWAEEVMKIITETAREESCKLARQRGAFPLFSESILPQDKPQRNGTVTTIAPTGTLSLLAGCSSGVEPVFGYVYIRNIMDGTEMIEVNPILKEVLEERGLYSDELMKTIAKQGSLSHIPEIPEDIRRVFVSAHEVSPEYHIRMQAAFPRYTDNAVSKTVNFNHDATREEVAQRCV